MAPMGDEWRRDSSEHTTVDMVPLDRVQIHDVVCLTHMATLAAKREEPLCICEPIEACVELVTDGG